MLRAACIESSRFFGNIRANRFVFDRYVTKTNASDFLHENPVALSTALAYPCAESVNIKNGFGVGHDVDADGLGLRVLAPCGQCGGSSSIASVSSDSALSRRRQLHAHDVSAMSSAETAGRIQKKSRTDKRYDE